MNKLVIKEDAFCSIICFVSKSINCSFPIPSINTSKKDNEGIEEYDNHTIEAIFVANKIHNLVEVEKPQIYDKNERIII